MEKPAKARTDADRAKSREYNRLRYEKRKPTTKQKQVVLLTLANKASEKPVPMTEVLARTDYGPTVQAHQVLPTIGSRAFMRELGLTEELISSSLVDDIIAKPGKRIQELRTGAELLGMLKKEDDTPKDKTNATYNFLFNETTKEDIKTIEEKIKARLIGQQPYDPYTTTP